MALMRNKEDAITLLLFTIIQITAVNCKECTQFFTIFEEKSCATSASIQMKPALINSMNWNNSRYEMDLDEYCYDIVKEDCFLELTCEEQETVCEEVIPSSTETAPTDTSYKYETTTAYYVTEESTYGTRMDYETDLVMEVTETTIIDEKEFFTIFTDKICGGSNTTVIQFASINYNTWNDSKYDSYGDCNEYPALDSFLEISCEEFATTCIQISGTSKLKSDESDEPYPAVQYTLISIGALASTILLSYIVYSAAEKAKDIIQSGVYRLPK